MPRTRNLTADSQAAVLQSIKISTAPDPALLPLADNPSSRSCALERKLAPINVATDLHQLRHDQSINGAAAFALHGVSGPPVCRQL